MKLYTEEQLLNTVKAVLEYDNLERIDKHIKALTPIELPSDEEIEKESMKFYDNNGADYYFEEGAKWVIEQIKQQQL